MSKFNVGDQVRSRLVDRSEVLTVHEVRGDRIRPRTWTAFYRSTDFEKVDVEPSVPDVDGNPIRVGQLVEHVGSDQWYRVVGFDDGRALCRCLCRHCTSAEDADYLPRHLRVVTDTFRPPEPETRVATVRVSVLCDPGTRDADVAQSVQDGLNEFDGEWVEGSVAVEVEGAVAVEFVRPTGDTNDD